MSWPVLKYSKNQVKRAGDTLISPDASVADRESAGDILLNWRAVHGYPINTFQATLRSRLKQVEPSALVGQRLKRTPSIIKKLIRFKDTMKLSTMQDIGGLRAVLSSLAKVRKLQATYVTSKSFKHELLRTKDYIEEPKDDGYRSVHLVFRYFNENAPAYSGLMLELQLRTKLQHSWATAVETMETFSGQALKSGQGDKRWRDFFALTSSAFAHIEDSPRVPGYAHLSREETFAAVAKAESELGVLTELGGFRIALEFTEKEKSSGFAYHLIVLDSLNKSVTITPFPRTGLDSATSAYAAAEARIKNGEKIEAVLVSAGPLDAMRRAFPNYFLDTKDFIQNVEKIISEGAGSRR